MKPKTKLQKRVDELSGFLPQLLTVKQSKYAFEKCFDHYGFRNSKTIHCMDCGSTFKKSNKNIYACPECKSQLSVVKTKKRTDKQDRIFCLIDSFKEFQIARFFLIKKESVLKYGSFYSDFEVTQIWITPEGKCVTRSILTRPFGNGWNLESQLEIRRDYYNLKADAIYPKMKVIPILKRNGFSGYFHNVSPIALFRALLSNNIAETLFKAKQFELFIHYLDRSKLFSVNTKIWQSIKICIRNNYMVPDAGMWIDHLETLETLGKDLLNPKYICPDDLMGAHTHYTKKLRDIERQKDLEEQKEKIEKEQKAYEKKKKRFFDIKISDGNIEIVVLDHVREFLIEGDILQHCIFTNEYYKKPESLILSARKGNERLETIEVDLKKLKVVQCRGFQNESTEYHDTIVDLVNSNIQTIRKLKRAQ
jgi:uncharacterized protein YbaR (Trm112 family)